MLKGAINNIYHWKTRCNKKQATLVGSESFDQWEDGVAEEPAPLSNSGSLSGPTMISRPLRNKFFGEGKHLTTHVTQVPLPHCKDCDKNKEESGEKWHKHHSPTFVYYLHVAIALQCLFGEELRGIDDQDLECLSAIVSLRKCLSP